MSEIKLMIRSVDERRRVQMPDDCPPGSTVTIQPIEDGKAWFVQVVRVETAAKPFELFPDCKCTVSTLVVPANVCGTCGKPWKLKKPALPDATVQRATDKATLGK